MNSSPPAEIVSARGGELRGYYLNVSFWGETNWIAFIAKYNVQGYSQERNHVCKVLTRLRHWAIKSSWAALLVRLTNATISTTQHWALEVQNQVNKQFTVFRQRASDD